MRSTAVLVFMAACLLAGGQAGAVGHDSGDMPSCRGPLALTMFRDKFADDQDKVWRTGLSITRFVQVSEAAFEIGTDLVARRYCEAKVVLNNGYWPTFLYMIEQRPGSIAPRVSYCLLNPADSQTDACGMVRPQFAGD